MAEPKGNLVTPVGHRSDGTIRAFDLSDNDELKVISSLTLIIDDSTVTQFIKSNSALNTTAIVHTVTAAKSFYLTSIFMRLYNGGAAAANGQLFVRDAADVLVYQWVNVAIVGSFSVDTLSFPIPIKIPAGYDICVATALAGVDIFGTITGFEK